MDVTVLLRDRGPRYDRDAAIAGFDVDEQRADQRHRTVPSEALADALGVSSKCRHEWACSRVVHRRSQASAGDVAATVRIAEFSVTFT